VSMGDCFGCFRPRDGKVGGGGGGGSRNIKSWSVLETNF